MVSESSSPDQGDHREESLRAVALVFADQGRRIAVTAGGRPALPEVSVPNRFYPEIEEFVRKTMNILGVHLSMLRCLDDGRWDEGRVRLYSLTSRHSDADLKDGFQWMDSAKVDSIAELSDKQTSSIRLERDRVAGQRPPRPAVPWEWPGTWDDDTRKWISDHLKLKGARSNWTTTPIRSWSISSVVRICAGISRKSERFYFKASPTFFSKEAAVTAEVEGRFPDISPRLVAVDKARGWMLMDDLGDITLGAADSPELWCEAMRALARIQIEFANDAGALDRLGIERRTTSETSATLREWTQDEEALDLHYASGRSLSALRRLEPHIKRVEQLCERVDSIGLPKTLDHGDLDAGNVFVRDGSPVIMDWSDASISSPLFAPVLIPQVSRNPLLARAFLAEWAEYVSMDRLKVAFLAAKPIAALERAFHYHRNIVAHLQRPSVDLSILEAYIPDLLNLAASELEQCV